MLVTPNFMIITNITSRTDTIFNTAELYMHRIRYKI